MLPNSILNVTKYVGRGSRGEKSTYLDGCTRSQNFRVTQAVRWIIYFPAPAATEPKHSNIFSRYQQVSSSSYSRVLLSSPPSFSPLSHLSLRIWLYLCSLPFFTSSLPPLLPFLPKIHTSSLLSFVTLNPIASPDFAISVTPPFSFTSTSCPWNIARSTATNYEEKEGGRKKGREQKRREKEEGKRGKKYSLLQYFLVGTGPHSWVLLHSARLLGSCDRALHFSNDKFQPSKELVFFLQKKKKIAFIVYS